MTNSVTKELGLVVASMRTEEVGQPFYMYGHIAEIDARLQNMNKNPKKFDKKYPLVALRLDTPGKVINGIIHYKLNVAIVVRTDKNYNAEQRDEKVFEPVLEPLYELFMEGLRQSADFMWGGDQTYPPHTKINRYYYGTPSATRNIKNVFSDPLDAIELVDLEINSSIKTC